MKAEELMIGDWVKLKDAKLGYIKFNGPTVKIESIVPPNVYVLNYKGLLEDVKDEYLLPIPLNPEILEKNGFMTGDKGRGYMGYMMYFLYDDEDHCLLGVKWYIKESMAEISLETTPYYIIIKHVHQLQHALKLCGIGKEIVL